jgi:kynurenine formamidase
MQQFIDLSHTFNDHMPVYPGDPIPELRQSAKLGEDGYNEFHLCTGMHVGTHVDAPLHMIEGGKRLSELPVSCFIGIGHLVEVNPGDPIDAPLLSGMEIAPGDFLVISTGWAEKFGKPGYYDEFPTVTEAFAHRAVELKVGMVALDTPSPDSSPFPIHKILLGGGVLIAENLTNLSSLRSISKFEIIAIPPPLDCEGAPTRITARVLA